MIMSSTSQLSDNVPVCRRGITSKQFGYLGELQARPSRTGFRESSDVQHYELTLIAALQTEMCIVEVARSPLLTITYQESVGPNTWPAIVKRS